MNRILFQALLKKMRPLKEKNLLFFQCLLLSRYGKSAGQLQNKKGDFIKAVKVIAPPKRPKRRLRLNSQLRLAARDRKDRLAANLFGRLPHTQPKENTAIPPKKRVAFFLKYAILTCNI